ncbi:protease-related family protein [Populus alba x Populus x berolinensis]|nr:protease-related family protein [Populus alba x Populus x berolinensis]
MQSKYPLFIVKWLGIEELRVNDVISGEDAHNTIVKKTAEKVLSSLQPHQIPAAVESIKQFLSSSQPKMTKLAEGYVSKYGKS